MFPVVSCIVSNVHPLETLARTVAVTAMPRIVALLGILKPNEPTWMIPEETAACALQLLGALRRATAGRPSLALTFKRSDQVDDDALPGVRYVVSSLLGARQRMVFPQPSSKEPHRSDGHDRGVHCC